MLFTLLRAKCLKLDCTPLGYKGGLSLDWSKPTTVIHCPFSDIDTIPTSGHDGKSAGGSWKCTPGSYKVSAFENVDVLMHGAVAAISGL